MVRAIDQLDLDVHHRVSGQHAVLERFLDALLDRRDVLARDHAADDLVLEHEARARLGRLHVDDHMAVLSLAARLPDELAFDLLDALANGLAVRHLRPTDIRLDLELAHHAVDDDLEVQLAHARDDRLRRLLVRVDAERRVFLRQLGSAMPSLS